MRKLYILYLAYNNVLRFLCCAPRNSSASHMFVSRALGDSSVFVLSRTGHFEYSPVHNSVNINGRNFILHLPGSCHICVSMCDQHFFVNYFNWLIYS